MCLDGAGKRHDGAAEDEGLEPVEIGILAERCGRGLVLADRPQDASPGAAHQTLEPDEQHPGDDRDQREIGEREGERPLL